MNRIYLDHNATTPMRPEALQALREAQAEALGNPSSLHRSGRRARELIDAARERVALALGVAEDEIVFTSGGTEANNLALFGTAAALGTETRLAVSVLEHASALEPARELSRRGHALTMLGVDAAGRTDFAALGAWLAVPAGAPDAPGGQGAPGRLLSLAAANGEIGVAADLSRVARMLDEQPVHARPVWHCDCVQALGRVDLQLGRSGIDLGTLSAHKVGGPPGIGVLYHRRGAPLCAQQHGGSQEQGWRAGTEPAAAIHAASVAIELAIAEREECTQRMRELELRFWESLARRVPAARLLGPPLGSPERIPGTLNTQVLGIDGKVLVTRLDLLGLEISAGSACASGSVEPSHVLLALGLDERAARAGLRISIGRSTRWIELEQAVEILSTALGENGATPRHQQGL